MPLDGYLERLIPLELRHLCVDAADLGLQLAPEKLALRHCGELRVC